MSKPVLAAVLTGLSVLMVVAGAWGAKRFIVGLPADHFVRAPPRRSLAVRIARTVAGVVIVAAGVAMLVLPGQGVLTIFVGLVVLELPFQRKVAKWLMARPAVARLIDGWRRQAGQPPLEMPEEMSPPPR